MSGRCNFFGPDNSNPQENLMMLILSEYLRSDCRFIPSLRYKSEQEAGFEGQSFPICYHGAACQ